MKTRSIACVLVLVLVTSCKKEEHAASTGKEESTTTHHAETEQSSEETRKLELSKLLESAKKSFAAHDVESALTALEKADELDEANPDVLNLRGSCHVELRNFEQALADFSQALKKMPDSSAIHFNIGEVHFVTKRWDDAIQSFNQAKDRLAPESEILRQLIDFKLMLCEAGRGNRVEFKAKVDANSQVQDTLLSEYTKVVRDFQAKDGAAARETMNKISEAFPNAEVREPWDDTLTEFGYVSAAQR